MTEKTTPRSISANKTDLAQVERIAEYHGVSHLGFSQKIRFIVQMVFDMIPRKEEKHEGTRNPNG